MKLFYAYSEKDFEDIGKMRQLLHDLLEGKTSKERFDTEMRRIKSRRLLEGRTSERRSQRKTRKDEGQESLV